MVRIAISQAAFDAIAATMALGSVGYENKTDEHGNRLVLLDRAIVDRLRSLRGPGESYSDVIIRVARGWAYSFQTMSQPGRADPQTTTAFLEPPPTTGRLRTGDAASVTQSRSPGIPSAGKVATVLWPIVAARQAVMKAARSIDRLYPL
jgi:hypothetical protein